MANRPQGFGLSRECEEKMNAKYDAGSEKTVVAWIEARTKRSKDAEVGPTGTFREWLLDGTVLCELINSFNVPGVTCRPNETRSVKLAAMKKMKENENIEMFLKGAEKLGTKREDLFQTVSVCENQNMAQVLSSMYAVSKAARTKSSIGPWIGVKEADKNERNFDEEKLREGRNIIGLQMGTNQVASQAGMTGYGQGRQIIHNTK